MLPFAPLAGGGRAGCSSCLDTVILTGRTYTILPALRRAGDRLQSLPRRGRVAERSEAGWGAWPTKSRAVFANE